MKKLSMLFCGIFLFAVVSNGQIALRAGLNLSSINADFDGISVESNSKIGFQLGAMYEIGVSDKLSIRPGLLFSSKGSTTEDPITGEDFKGGINYLEIPIDIVYYILKSDNSFSLSAGPYIGYAIGVSGDAEGSLEENGIKPLDLGVNLGLQYDFQNKYGIGFYYGLGIANISEEDDLLGIDVTTTNNNLAFVFSYKL